MGMLFVKYSVCKIVAYFVAYCVSSSRSNSESTLESEGLVGLPLVVQPSFHIQLSGIETNASYFYLFLFFET